MKVLFVAAEMAPFAKTGGLGDVVGSLPKALRELGIDARVVMPHYSMIWQAEYRFNYRVPRRQGDGDVTVHEGNHDGVPVYFLKSWPYFVDDGKIYTTWDWDSPRFIYFCQMAMAFTWELMQGHLGGEPWQPDVIHVHDWHTGLVPFLLHEARFNEGWQDIASVISLHNMAFQGGQVGGWLWQEGLNNRENPDLPYQEWRDNMLAIGIAYSNKINTVSPNHAVELHYPRFGEGLQELIWRRDADFRGILNGIDTDIFNPETDPHNPHHYNVENFRTERVKNKLALQEALNLEVNPDIPMLAYIGRVTPQKGLDFTIPALQEILATENVQFIGLGAGDAPLEKALSNLGLNFGGKARTYLAYNFNLAQKLYGAADLMLVPSRYEPCGLTQIISMRYGCIPLVRETGGLVDTVENFDNKDGKVGTGFRFLFEEPNAVRDTIRWALDIYRNNHTAWQQMQINGMSQDWGWGKHAQAYITMYQEAIAQKRAWRKFL